MTNSTGALTLKSIEAVKQQRAELRRTPLGAAFFDFRAKFEKATTAETEAEIMEFTNSRTLRQVIQEARAAEETLLLEMRKVLFG